MEKIKSLYEKAIAKLSIKEKLKDMLKHSPFVKIEWDKVKKLERVDKLQLLADLTCHLYQHTPLNVAPSWFGGCEDNGYSPEDYGIGWQNKYYHAGIDITNAPNEGYPDYHFWLTIHEYQKGYLLNERFQIKDILGIDLDGNFGEPDPMNLPKFKEFIEFANENFHPKAEQEIAIKRTAQHLADMPAEQLREEFDKMKTDDTKVEESLKADLAASDLAATVEACIRQALDKAIVGQVSLPLNYVEIIKEKLNSSIDFNVEVKVDKNDPTKFNITYSIPIEKFLLGEWKSNEKI